MKNFVKPEMKVKSFENESVLTDPSSPITAAILSWMDSGGGKESDVKAQNVADFTR